MKGAPLRLRYMIPLFKSHYSIGKSILKIPQIFSYPDETIVLVEDTMCGFRYALKESRKTGKKFIFGLRLLTKGDFAPSKVVYLAKNNNGISSLRKIFTKSNFNDGIYELDLEDLEDIKVCIPFYDSFLFDRVYKFGSSYIDFGGVDVTYFEEDNEHPLDFLLKEEIKKNNIKTVAVKSIFYDKNSDFKAFQAYKAICSRTKPPTFHNPNVRDLSSDKFSYEEYVKQVWSVNDYQLKPVVSDRKHGK